MKLPDIIKSEEEVVFKDINKKIFKNFEATYMIIRNSVITECIFENISLGNCDFICNKVCNTNFRNIYWGSSDIFSTWFSNCTFIDVDFTGSSIEDITFTDCIFTNCIFKDVSLKKSIFNNCSFNQIEPTSTIFSLNNYNECTFTECAFSGSFEYQLFKKCIFIDTIIAASALEYNFGLRNHQGIRYIQNNQEIDDISDILELLINKCVDNKLFINAVLINYNFANYINPELAIKSLHAIEQMLKNDILLSNDELTFIKHLYHHLYINELIAPIVLFEMFETVKKMYINSMDNISYEKCKESLHMVANSLYFDFCNFCEKLNDSIRHIPLYTGPAYIQIHYDEEPTVSLEDLLNKCIPGIINRTEVRKGSFIEYFEIGKNGLELLAIFLQLLGIAVPIIYTEIKSKKKNNERFGGTSINIDIEAGTSLVSNDREISDLIQQTSHVITTSSLLNVNLQGYNNDNIKDIKIKYEVNIHT